MTETMLDRQFAMTDRDFRTIAALVYERAGINLTDAKRQLVYSRLSKRLRVLGLASFEAYCERLDGGDAADEMGFLLNAITTNLTSFFREKHHFEHMTAQLSVPHEEGGLGGSRKLRIWSSACSSGEEPYSIAVTLLRAGIASGRVDAKILATDLDTNMLERGRQGLYPLDAFKGMTQKEIERFTESDDSPGTSSRRMGQAARALIHFKPLNLIQNWPMRGPFDVIFCRNVIIYFDASTKARLVDRMAALLRPGGHLYLGHSESLVQKHPLLTLVGRTIYRRQG